MDASFSEEVRDPHIAQTFRRSIWLAAPLIALFYILGTACVLTFTPPNDIDLMLPTTQVLSRGAQATSLALVVTPFIAALMICNLVGNGSLYFNAVARLPMVAGWDYLVPPWLSRLHPHFKTPVGSIICLGLLTFCLMMLGNLGVGAQESFQLLNSLGLICWALTYLVMFAIPLAARGENSHGPPAWRLHPVS